MNQKRNRPDQSRTDSRRFAGATTTSVRASWTIDENVPDEHCIDLSPHHAAGDMADAFKVLSQLPLGTSITLVVEPDQLPWNDAIAFLASIGSHLGEIVITGGDRATLTAWVWAIRWELDKAAGGGR